MKTIKIQTILLMNALLLAFFIPAVLLIPAANSAFPYRDYEPFMAAFIALAQAHPKLVTYEAVGTTVLGRDIIMFKIGNPDGGKVLFDGALHGTEAEGSELLYSYAKWLLESGDTLAQNILQTTYTLLIPVVNADKENYARKNANGVDLNRNFATSWANDGSSDPTSDTYRGPSALSEPESQTLVNVFETFKPSFYVNLHMWAGPYYAGCRYANSTYYSTLVSRIANLSRTRGTTPFPYSGQFGGAGMAIADAARAGITSFLIELTQAVIPLSEVQTTLLAKFIPVASVLSEEAKPPVRYDHDIAVTSLTPSKTVISKGLTLSFDVEVANLGLNAETFNLTVNLDESPWAKVEVNLQPGEVRSYTMTWNSSPASYGNHTLNAYASPVVNETETSNNQIEVSPIVVTLTGDISGNYEVDIYDALTLAHSFGTDQDSPNWNPNADIDGDNTISINDIILCAAHFSERLS